MLNVVIPRMITQARLERGINVYNLYDFDIWILRKIKKLPAGATKARQKRGKTTQNRVSITDTYCLVENVRVIQIKVTLGSVSIKSLYLFVFVCSCCSLFCVLKNHFSFPAKRDHFIPPFIFFHFFIEIINNFIHIKLINLNTQPQNKLY